MGIFDKLMFWKKKDEFDLGADLGAGMGGAGLGTGVGAGGLGDLGLESPGFGQPQGYAQASGYAPPSGANLPRGDFGMGQQYQFQQPPMQSQQPFMQQPSFNMQQGPSPSMKDIEVVSSKLDALRAVLDSINQRLANLEKMAAGEYEPRRRTW